MLSEKWRERAAQRTSLAQNNADLHGRLDRAQSRSHEQQETIEHLQVCYGLTSNFPLHEALAD